MANQNRERLEYYDKDGKIVDKQESAVAKLEDGFYYIRIHTTGINRGDLLNISGRFDLSDQDRAFGRDLYMFTKVNQKSFDAYMDYLTSKKESFLTTAERLRIQ